MRTKLKLDRLKGAIGCEFTEDWKRVFEDCIPGRYKIFDMEGLNHVLLSRKDFDELVRRASAIDYGEIH